jgi:phage major head subunit gpT-like protein
MAIDVEDVRRDSLGMFESKASEMGAKFADHVNKLVISQMTANPVGFDGVSFFGSTHPVNGTTQTNDLSSSQVASLASSGYTGATASAPTPVMMAAVILGIAAYSYSLIDEAGDPINGGAKEFEFVTSNPAVYAAMISAIDSLQLSQGQTNVLDALQDGGAKARYTYNPKSFRFLAMFDPRLGSSTSSVFYTFRTDSDVKPFAWGEESGLEINYLGEGSYPAVKDNQFIWAAKAVRSVGVGRYQHAFRATIS